MKLKLKVGLDDDAQLLKLKIDHHGEFASGTSSEPPTS